MLLKMNEFTVFNDEEEIPIDSVFNPLKPFETKDGKHYILITRLVFLEFSRMLPTGVAYHPLFVISE